MSPTLALYTYWRSSAAYRVRIGLNLKGLPHTLRPVHLLRDGGQQHAADYAALNPQHLLPTLCHDGQVLTQSLAILEYLDEAFPDTPALLPPDAPGRARIRALAQAVACDVHPLNNLRVLQYCEQAWGIEAQQREEWARHWMRLGLDALEASLAGSAGPYVHGQAPGLAECCLVPQLYNARRYAMDLSAYPRLTEIEAACLSLAAFDRARPENQPDAP